MGQGVCAGIRDVANLYWKLALVCQGKVTGQASEDPLDSYESERKSNAREYIRAAVHLGGLINTADSEDALRAALPSADGSARMESIAPPLGPGLGLGDKAGRLFGQPRLTDGTLIDQLYRDQFAVVAEDDLVAGITLPEGVARVTTSVSNAAGHLARFGARATVLRPDRHTLGGADTREALEALLARILPDPTSLKKPETV